MREFKSMNLGTKNGNSIQKKVLQKTLKQQENIRIQ